MVKKQLKLKYKILLVVIIAFILLVTALITTYKYLEGPVNKKETIDVQITIPKGASVKEIAKELKDNHLIRSEILFRLFVRQTNHTLKAATYQLQRNMSLKQIIDILTDGNTYNPDAIRLTFLEGKTIKKYAEVIADKTNHSYDEVMNFLADKTYIQSLIDKYWFLTDEILNPNIYVALEGYLAPNTYEFENKDVSIEKIFDTMLDQTAMELEPYKDKITDQKTLHQYLTLASVLELEGLNLEDRKMIAGVFNNRLNSGMNMGSDVTTYYALQKDMTTDLTVTEFQTINLYNTRASNMGGKLPIGPICNPSSSAIEASFNPTNNDYLYFVTDKNGKVYYTKTEREHLKQVEEIKEAGNWIW